MKKRIAVLCLLFALILTGCSVIKSDKEAIHVYTKVYTASFSDNQWVKDGSDIDGHREIYKDGVSFGPYLQVQPGRYLIVLKGSNLDKASITFTSDAGQNKVDAVKIIDEADSLEYFLPVNDPLEQFEIVIRNQQDDVVVLDSIVMEKID